VTAVGVALGAAFAFLAALHVVWAFGGTWGAGAAIPETGGRRSFALSRFATLALAAALAAAVIVLARAELILTSAPPWASRWPAAALGVAFLLRSMGDFRLVGFFKSISGTRFARWDTRLYSPLCLLLGLGALWLARQ
jgi:Protein of unknown function (DUF3995)